jgi:hypothetical protein
LQYLCAGTKTASAFRPPATLCCGQSTINDGIAAIAKASKQLEAI